MVADHSFAKVMGDHTFASGAWSCYRTATMYEIGMPQQYISLFGEESLRLKIVYFYDRFYFVFKMLIGKFAEAPTAMARGIISSGNIG
jgi:hypothetical protein